MMLLDLPPLDIDRVSLLQEWSDVECELTMV